MADYRNHWRFMLSCIKVSITPVSCRLKNPMKTPKSYHIIHTAERQLVQERVRDIKHTLHLWELKRHEWYAQLRNSILDSDLSRCILLVNKIKEFRHNKTKSRQRDKFNRLSNKITGYMQTTMVLALSVDIGFLVGGLLSLMDTLTETYLALPIHHLHLQYQCQHCQRHPTQQVTNGSLICITYPHQSTGNPSGQEA